MPAIANNDRKNGKQESNLKQYVRSDDDLEMALRYLEKKRFQDVIEKLNENKIEIAGFYHSSKWQNHWESVIAEQLKLVDGNRFRVVGQHLKWGNRLWTSLLEISKYFQMTVAGTKLDYENITAFVHTLDLKNRNKIALINAPTVPRSAYRYGDAEKKKELRKLSKEFNLTEGEYFTFDSAHRYCRQQRNEGKNSYIYYFHSKGTTYPKKSKSPVSDWRDEMNAFNLEFPSTCLRALLNGYSTCGVEYQDAHYSGNYWWANCSHVASLPGLWDPIDNAYACEYFIFNVSRHQHKNADFGRHCGFNPFHCNINHYNEACPREKYIPTILNLLSSENLPISPTQKLKIDVKDTCGNLAAKPYLSNKKEWDSGKNFFE